mmetsp:Transcript_8364/g.19633  ORF Transcript_8364/g.19633 Transcript_8364/m.19633 type:complete len:217 (-) Transcript_8364:97-747(-)
MSRTTSNDAPRAMTSARGRTLPMPHLNRCRRLQTSGLALTMSSVRASSYCFRCDATKGQRSTFRMRSSLAVALSSAVDPPIIVGRLSLSGRERWGVVKKGEMEVFFPVRAFPQPGRFRHLSSPGLPSGQRRSGLDPEFSSTMLEPADNARLLSVFLLARERKFDFCMCSLNSNSNPYAADVDRRSRPSSSLLRVLPSSLWHRSSLDDTPGHAPLHG